MWAEFCESTNQISTLLFKFYKAGNAGERKSFFRVVASFFSSCGYLLILCYRAVKMSVKNIYYSDKYFDDQYEYR